MERSFRIPDQRRHSPSIPFPVLFPAIVTGINGAVCLLIALMFVSYEIPDGSCFILVQLLYILASLAAFSIYGMIRNRPLTWLTLLVFTVLFIPVTLVGLIRLEIASFNMFDTLNIGFAVIVFQLFATVVFLVHKNSGDLLDEYQRSLQQHSESGATASTNRKGEVLRGRYEVLELLGQGASGAVYLVRDLTFQGSNVRWVLKEIGLRGLSFEEREEAHALFEKECNLLKSLNHPAIPKLIEHFRHEDSAALVMEYVEGKSLESMLKEEGRPLEVERVIEIAEELLSILSYLHGQNPHPLIFRDLKPSNIMITGKGRLRLIDFGIARYHSPGKDKDTLVYGTPGFSPPEQYGTGQTDERSDIYAFGATLYNLLTNEDPSQFSFNFPPLRSINSSVPQSLETLVMQCLRFARQERPASAGQIRKELDNIMDGIPAFRDSRGRELWFGYYFIAAAIVTNISFPGCVKAGYEMAFPILASIAVAGSALFFLVGRISAKMKRLGLSLFTLAALLALTARPGFT
ncbi:MAG: serine/threonine protein kinase [Candidatus Xenobiia bacterium LiM19]